MNAIGIFLLAMLGLGLFLWYWFYFRNRDFKEVWRGLGQTAGIPKEPAPFKYRYTTPEGMKIVSTRVIPARFLQNADIGVLNQIKQYTYLNPHWINRMKVSEYRLAVIDPVRTNEDGTPALLTNGQQAAGTCIGVTAYTIPHDWMVTVHQEDSGWKFPEYWRNSIWYESEHIRERYNDQPTFDHFATSGDVHPHAFSDSVSVIPYV